MQKTDKAGDSVEHEDFRGAHSVYLADTEVEDGAGLHSNYRTAVYRTVRTVVREDGSTSIT